jgi:hypothetical protein
MNFFDKFMITLLRIMRFITRSHRFSGRRLPMRYEDHEASRGLMLWHLPQGAVR